MRIRACVAALAAAIGLAACGSSTTTTSSTTITHTATDTLTHTVKLSSIPPVTTTTTVTTTVTTLPVPSSSFSGNGGENLPTIHVSQPSLLQWTNDGSLFSITSPSDEIFVNSQGSSGSSQVQPGTYTGVSVNADGNWTIKIVPEGAAGNTGNAGSGGTGNSG